MVHNIFSDPSVGGAFLILAESQEIKDEWMARLKALLDQQLDFVRALSNPRQQQAAAEAAG
jgi:hypothetical protein